MGLIRACINPACSRSFSGCNGFVIARDVSAYQDGKRAAQHIRELCGVCVHRFAEDNPAKFEKMLRENSLPKSLAT
jgi:hypothetical protein